MLTRAPQRKGANANESIRGSLTSPIWCPNLQWAASQGRRIMSGTGIPKAEACVTHLMQGGTVTPTECEWETKQWQSRKDIFHVCVREAGGEVGACHPCLIWLFVHTNHWIAASKWEKLVFSVTNWPRATRALTERGNGEGKHGECGEGGDCFREQTYKILWLKNLKIHPFPCLNHTKFNIIYTEQLWKKINLVPSALWSKLTNVELSDLGAETMHTEYAVCPTTPTSYCCVCMAALVKLWWVFPPWEAEHDMRSTMAGRWRASSIWWWPPPQRPLFLMWRNTRAAWFIMGAQVARDLMSRVLCSSNGSRRRMHMLKNKSPRCHLHCSGISCFFPHMKVTNRSATII